MPTTTDLLIGSIRFGDTQSMSVTTAGPVTEDCDVAIGNYYLYDDESPFDLFDAVGDALSGHSALGGGVGVLLGVDLHVHLVGSGVAFAVNWADATELRDALGFTTNLTSATSHRAPNISPLLWSAGRPVTWEARLGTNGIKVVDVARGQSGPSTVRTTRNNTRRRNTLIYSHILGSRVWTTDEENGEFVTFWDEVLVNGRRFKVWRNYPEDLADSTTLQNPNDSPNFGPIPSGSPSSETAYIYTGPSEMPFARENGFHEKLVALSIPVVTTRDFDA